MVCFWEFQCTITAIELVAVREEPRWKRKWIPPTISWTPIQAVRNLTNRRRAYNRVSYRGAYLSTRMMTILSVMIGIITVEILLEFKQNVGNVYYIYRQTYSVHHIKSSNL